ncbi:MAG TPA: AraC family transcriptional regulator, partial [Dongiaceae bacterium]|nr:AraC family transcriptional regulator [Dongiaceae bacterium]
MEKKVSTRLLLNSRIQLRSALPSFYCYDEESNFAVKVASSAAYEVAEHQHNDIQITIPLGRTTAEVRWRRVDGIFLTALARSGDAMIVPPHQRHAVAWRREARFVNLHFGPLADDDASALFASVATAGEMHVVKDSFISTFGKNIASLVARGAEIDPAMMMGFRLMLLEHIINTYAPDRKSRRSEASRQIKVEKPGGVHTPQGPTLTFATPGAAIDKVLMAKPPIMVVNGLAPWQLRKVMTTVEADLRHDHSVAELSELVNLSKGHFSRAFRASTGLSPRQWIIQERVKLAISKLAG